MAKRRKTRISSKHNRIELVHIARSLCFLVGRPIYYLLASIFIIFPTLLLAVTTPRLLEILSQGIISTTRTSTQKVSNFFAPVQSVIITAADKLRKSGMTLGFWIGVMLFSTGAWFYFYVLKDLPSPRELVTREQIVTTKIYDRNGELLYKIYKDENRTLVPLSSIPEYVRDATIAIEDKDFYTHSGFSISGIVRAVKANLERKQVQGGSTITQQLVKNTLLTPEKTLRRKLRELVLAILVEATLTKDEILEMYFNESSYGGSVYGVEEASRKYFNKGVRELTLAEAAYLSGLPQAPSAYSPFGSTPEFGFQRQHQVLQRMIEDGYITQEQADQAKAEKITFQPDLNNIKAPHFVMYVRDVLAKEYGENVVAQGGLEVTTTLDYGIQQLAQKAVEQELDRLKRLRVSNAAALVTNPKTGEILAMVGSKDYFDFENDGQVNVTIRQRQPGSSIKPLTYAVGLERGMTPSTIIDDSPITYRTIGSPPYSPKNYDGKFHGKVTVRTALASSYNIPAVKTLANVGLPAVIEKARLMGITTWGEEEAKRFGLSLTLGGGEVLMVDMAKLYGTFANDGMTTELSPILSVKNYKGEVLYTNPCEGKTQPCLAERSLDPRVAYQITSILSDNGARASAFGTNSVLNIPKQQVAVKTGTTNSLRDNWTIGYTADKVVATWVGNNDNTPMSAVASGITGASPIWNTIMKGLLDENAPHQFHQPSGLVKVRICAPTGTLGCQACPVHKDEYFVSGTEPKQACNDEMFKPKDPNATPSPSPATRDQILQGVQQTRN
jgi:1A family penicillin-binding protein